MHRISMRSCAAMLCFCAGTAAAQTDDNIYELTPADKRSMENRFSEAWDSVRTSGVFAAPGSEGEGLVFVCGKVEARYKEQYLAPRWFMGALGRREPETPTFHVLAVSDRSDLEDAKILSTCIKSMFGTHEASE